MSLTAADHPTGAGERAGRPSVKTRRQEVAQTRSSGTRQLRQCGSAAGEQQEQHADGPR